MSVPSSKMNTLIILLTTSFHADAARPFAAEASARAVSPKEFAVMAWGDSPSDPDELRGMKEAGLNISGFCRAEDLDRVKAAGLTCFVNDPKINRLRAGQAPRY